MVLANGTAPGMGVANPLQSPFVRGTWEVGVPLDKGDYRG